MSQHKSGQSNWTEEQKQLYRERRERGLHGTPGIVTVHRIVKDESGKDQRVPIGNRIGSLLSRGKSAGRTQLMRANQKAYIQQKRKSSGRGD